MFYKVKSNILILCLAVFFFGTSVGCTHHEYDEDYPEYPDSYKDEEAKWSPDGDYIGS